MSSPLYGIATFVGGVTLFILGSVSGASSRDEEFALARADRRMVQGSLDRCRAAASAAAEARRVAPEPPRLTMGKALARWSRLTMSHRSVAGEAAPERSSWAVTEWCRLDLVGDPDNLTSVRALSEAREGAEGIACMYGFLSGTAPSLIPQIGSIGRRLSSGSAFSLSADGVTVVFERSAGGFWGATATPAP